MGGTVDTCSKHTQILNTKSQEFLSPKTLPDIVEGTWVSLIMTLPNRYYYYYYGGWARIQHG